MVDAKLTQEFKDRLADRYTASELVDLLGVPVEDIINEYWDRILESRLLLEEVGLPEED